MIQFAQTFEGTNLIDNEHNCIKKDYFIGTIGALKSQLNDFQTFSN